MFIGVSFILVYPTAFQVVISWQAIQSLSLIIGKDISKRNCYLAFVHSQALKAVNSVS
ncbi:hypothetical protein GCM10007978_01810 [Shewanella hanedai]|nr:hypothetical protein GCM10007978_01810 [Shewanella hanedai]